MAVLDFLNFGTKILDKLIPDPAQRDEAKLKFLTLQQNGEFKEEELRYSAINAEASSTDKWTSRARPSFLYVMYALLLASIPFGIFYAFSPGDAIHVAEGFKAWLDAIPETMWQLFGAGYIGYSITRSADKFSQAKSGK